MNLEAILSSFYYTFIFENRWIFFVNGLLMTLILTLSSFLLGSLFGAIVCGLRFKLKGKAKTILEIINGFFVQIPTLVLLMIFMYVVFNDLGLSAVVVCIIGLTFKNSAYLSDIFYSAVTSVSEGEIEAASALGMSKVQAFMKVTLPQAADNAMEIYQNQFISCLQETSVVGSLAVEELTRVSSIITSRTLDAIFSLICISIIYIFIGFVGNRVIGMINKKKHLGGEAQ